MTYVLSSEFHITEYIKVNSTLGKLQLYYYYRYSELLHLELLYTKLHQYTQSEIDDIVLIVFFLKIFCCVHLQWIYRDNL